ncbi:MAG: PepSY domain-containing protein, partial [Candidatus Dadabacteria bacterium]|nr:PepSY domain-containing protein [Candidatus Dadabacteria bacterium]
MLSAKTIKIWYAVHKWTSLVCTVFLLLLCLTGLPLIFIHELSHLLDGEVATAAVPPGTPKKSLDEMVGKAREKYPDEYVRFLGWDEDEPDLLFVTFVPSRYDMSGEFRSVAVDVHTGGVVDFSLNRFLDIMFHLHVDLFAGLYGMLFLGFMGLLFVASLVSGVVLYGPFMRKLDFGVVRKGGVTRLKWLDLHNLLGVVTLMWAFVVGGTGVINTLAEVV